MNNKYLKAVEGIPEGSEILRKLSIGDSDPFDKAKLESIQNAVKAMKDGASLQDATKGALTIAREGKELAKGDQLPPTQIPEEVQQGIEEIVLETVKDDAESMPELIAAHSEAAAEEVAQGLEGFVKGVYFGAVSQKIKTPAFKDAVRAAIKKRKADRSKK